MNHGHIYTAFNSVVFVSDVYWKAQVVLTQSHVDRDVLGTGECCTGHMSRRISWERERVAYIHVGGS